MLQLEKVGLKSGVQPESDEIPVLQARQFHQPNQRRTWKLDSWNIEARRGNFFSHTCHYYTLKVVLVVLHVLIPYLSSLCLLAPKPTATLLFSVHRFFLPQKFVRFYLLIFTKFLQTKILCLEFLERWKWWQQKRVDWKYHCISKLSFAVYTSFFKGRR